MSLFDKLRTANSPSLPRQGGATPRTHVAAAVATKPTNAAKTGSSTATLSGTSRLSNGLKEFLSQLDGIGRGHLLDLGPARQTTLTFFIERGFKVYTEDLLITWKNFLDGEGQREKQLVPGSDRSEMMPAARADRFLET